MKAKLLSLFKKWASWKSVLFFFALQMLFNIVIMPAFSGSNQHDLPTLDLQFAYTPERAYEIVASYTPEMRQAAAFTRLTLDIIYPIIYGMMLSLLLMLTFRRAFVSRPFADAAVFLPWGGVLFDYLENICFAIIFLAYPQKYPFIAQLAAIFTSIKWSLIGLSFVLIVVGGVKWLLTKK